MQSYRSVPLLMFFMIIASSAFGCGDDAECAIDTDCPVFQRCNADNQCVAIGVPDAEVDAGDASADGGMDAEAGMMDGDIPDAEVLGQGIVQVESNGTNTTASATFNPTPEPSSCTLRELGACDVRTCTRELPMVPDAGVDAGMDAGMDADVPDAVAASHAGSIAVSGTGGRLDLFEDTTTGLYANVSRSVVWTDEAPGVTIEASGGGGVDSFMLSFDAPPVVTVTDPTNLSALSTLTAGTDFELDWRESRTGGTGMLLVSIVPTAWEEGETEQKSAHCEFPLGTGGPEMVTEGNIGGGILGMLPTGRTYRLTFAVESGRETMAGPWLVRGVANTVVGSGGGTFSSGVVTLQPSMP